jgi:hypothetical protein
VLTEQVSPMYKQRNRKRKQAHLLRMTEKVTSLSVYSNEHKG